jgi:kynureninase
MDWLNRSRVGVEEIRGHVLSLQERFLTGLKTNPKAGLSLDSLLTPRAAERRGNFLTFRLAQAGSLADRLHEGGVVTDHRGDRLRFGFGLYQDPEDVDELLGRLARL